MIPNSMNLKEWLIKKLSLKILQPEKIINVVITEQFDSANDAVNIKDSVELSGFGKFLFNKKRAIKRMEKYLKERDRLIVQLEKDITENERNSLENRLFVMELNIKVLKPRIHESKPNL